MEFREWLLTEGGKPDYVGRNFMGHDLYVTDARYCTSPIAPRVLLRCSRCGRLGVGLIKTEDDRAYAAGKDREFDTGEWWDFRDLEVTGSLGVPCGRGDL